MGNHVYGYERNGYLSDKKDSSSEMVLIEENKMSSGIDMRSKVFSCLFGYFTNKIKYGRMRVNETVTSN